MRKQRQVTRKTGEFKIGNCSKRLQAAETTFLKNSMSDGNVQFYADLLIRKHVRSRSSIK